ncbi:heme peroxidase [Thozetella sp. PMI_491]|nr:heme peroxidase [Thozetella sp. PMI_491]
MLALVVLLSGWRLVAAYTWPDPLTDEIERMLYEQNGNDFATPGLGMPTCAAIPGDRPPFSGRSNAAEWVRTAYHDMATADVVAGTGGIDASIGFESSRAENPGLAFSESIGFFVPFQSTRASMADMIALGAILALGKCSDGGIIVPMRVGRVDATEAGPPGVPEPQQDLDSHTAAFSRQGFNTTEMIGLVACGHTLGGVHGNDFPDIAPAIDDNRQDFDGSFDVFDNSVAVQFVNNNTQNPLAFGKNATTNSDERIFHADGGNLIRQMADSNDLFLSTCASLMERMLNTVPRTVELSEPVEPRAVKPRFLRLDVNTGNDTITLAGSIRIMNDDRTSINRTVFLDFQSRDAATCLSSGLATCEYSVQAQRTSASHTWTGLYPGMPSFYEYNFETNVPASIGVSSFNIRLQDGETTITETNGGAGYPWDDTLQPQLDRSCIGIPETAGGWRNVTVAVRRQGCSHLTTRSVLIVVLIAGARRRKHHRPYSLIQLAGAPRWRARTSD